MQYRCPKCQSVKIMPVSQGANSPRPNVPKSLVLLVPAIFILLILVLISMGCGFLEMVQDKAYKLRQLLYLLCV